MRIQALKLVPLVLFACAPLFARADDNWQIIKVNNRDYLSVENVARFYELQSDVKRADNHLSLGDSQVRLETTGNPKELYINGVKQCLSFPMIT